VDSKFYGSFCAFGLKGKW